MTALDENPFPRGALIGAGLLIAATISAVGAVQLHKHFQPSPPPVADAVVTSRDLRFVDAGNGVNAFGGDVRVFDVATGAELEPLSKSDGFVRAVLNSLAFERSKRGVVAAPVFSLVRWSGNKLTIEDRATGARVNLGAFGSENRAVFTRFLERDRRAS